MGKFDGVLLASDFDDTFITSDLIIPPENLRALGYFTGQGGVFTIATGRAHATFAPYASVVPFNAPVVLSNGSALYDFKAGRMVHETFLPPWVAGDLEEVARVFPDIGFEAYHGDDIYAYQPNGVTEAHITRAKAHYTQLPIAQMPQPWSKVILEQDNPLLLQVQAYMLERWGAHYEVIFSNAYLLELTRKGSHKGGMVAHLAGLLGVAPGRVYCVGDNQNDIPMLAISAIPFAPANCAQAVKDWGARILRPCQEGTIAQIVEILDGLY